MSRRLGPPAQPATADLERWGIDPRWSRFVDVAGSDGVRRRWHVLDTGPAAGIVGVDAAAPTIVCVHGNPTWSFFWRSFLHHMGDRHRVIAVDQLGMGYSERTEPRRFAQRVDDLADVIDALDVQGDVVVAAHDWGGPISLGWVLRNTARVRGVVLCNTGVAVPAGRRAPALIRLAGAGPITALVGRRTRLFVDGTLALSGRRIARIAREGYRAPYRHAADRAAIAEFVADVPFTDAHPSAAPIAAVADGIRELTVPVLLVSGSADPVFNDDFAADLVARMPHADRQRFRGIGHLVVEETDVAGLVDQWLTRLPDTARQDTQAGVPDGSALAATSPPIEGQASPPIWAGLDGRSTDDGIAYVHGATGESISFRELHGRVMGIAGGLVATGVEPGDRVAVLVEPGVDLLATAYGCWRAGAVTVIADRGLGLRGLGRAVRGAHVHWVIGRPTALRAARWLRWAPRARRIAVGGRRSVSAVATLDELSSMGAPLPPAPSPQSPAAVLYTSGATGPAKGVRYLHGQMANQRDAVASLYGITADDRLVAAFAPFALYGPALGITSAIPDVDVTAPRTLTCAALGDAVAAIDATIVFASPSALDNVERTAPGTGDARLASLRLVLSAGAPVPIATLRAMSTLCPVAELHTPYGMTECLPVADIELKEIDEAVRTERGVGGVCVGRPCTGVDVLIAPLWFAADAPVAAVAAHATGEILVRAPWVSAGYDQLWRTQREARPGDACGTTWHRTGDVGHVDPHGRLWVEGRSVHVIDADPLPITPVPVEVAVDALESVGRSAAVGVGPRGCQQLVVVIEDSSRAAGIAPAALAAQVRTVVHHPVAAVLTVGDLPVDIRHNTKIDRTAVAGWADAVLAGRRTRPAW